MQHICCGVALSNWPHLAEVEPPEVRRSPDNAERQANEGTQAGRDDLDV